MPASSPALASSSSVLNPRFGPAHVHAQHHLGPVLGVGAARARVDGDERVPGVVVAGEQPLLLGRVQTRLDGRDRLFELGGDVLVLLGHLGEALEVLRVGLQLREAVQAPLRAGVLGPDLRRRVRVVPEAGRAHLRLERLEAFLHLRRVQIVREQGHLLADGGQPLRGGLIGGHGEAG